MSDIWLANVLAYSLQLTVLVSTALLVTRVFPVAHAVWRFRLWQAVFAAAVVLPLPQLWTRADSRVSAIASFIIGSGQSASGIEPQASWLDVVAIGLVAGAAVRIARLLLGLVAIRRLVERATLLNGGEMADAIRHRGTQMEVRMSAEVCSPATVGFWRAVILVPTGFRELPPAAQRAVLTHEQLHVVRGDWLHRVVEEVWCALLWFHPMARVLVSRLDLTREMLVDRRVIDATNDRGGYARALLAFAEGPSSASTVTPLIRLSHLSQRVAALTEEAPMSRRLSIVALVVVCLTVSAATATTVLGLPMSAPTAHADSAPSRDEPAVTPGEGVTLPKPTYEEKPQYTAAAMQAKIEGTVLLSIVIEADGTVGRVRVTKSLDTKYGLDDEAVRAARQWRFVPGRKDGKAVPVEVSLELTFTLRK